jgi:hypothetical protein
MRIRRSTTNKDGGPTPLPPEAPALAIEKFDIDGVIISGSATSLAVFLKHFKECLNETRLGLGFRLLDALSPSFQLAENSGVAPLV